MVTKPTKLLVIRRSALGDVAMTIPVISSLKKQYPNAEITVVSKPWMKPLFDNANIKFIGANPRSGAMGIVDAFRFFSMIRKAEKWDAIIDLHDVIFSKLIRTLFKFSGILTQHIDKGRSDKKALTKYPDKNLRQLSTSFERYADTFKRAGFPINLDFKTIYSQLPTLPAEVIAVLGNKESKWIGIAPFAQHKGKIYPIEKMEEVVRHFNQKGDAKIVLFGGGKAEKEALEAWEKKYEHAVSVAGRFNLGIELQIISHLDVMVSMDSANMHLASLTATPAVSVWGATHPYAGFYGWNQPIDNIVQEELDCRPCSVFGNKECMWGDYRCMNNIGPERIVKKVEEIVRQ